MWILWRIDMKWRINATLLRFEKGHKPALKPQNSRQTLRAFFPINQWSNAPNTSIPHCNQPPRCLHISKRSFRSLDVLNKKNPAASSAKLYKPREGFLMNAFVIAGSRGTCTTSSCCWDYLYLVVFWLDPLGTNDSATPLNLPEGTNGGVLHLL